MARRGSDTRALVLAAVGAVAAGLLVALALWAATGRGGSPTEYQPFDAGVAAGIKADLKDGGPYYVADPFGGDRSILFALEDGELVALSITRPGTDDCTVRWRDSRGGFEDCDGNLLESNQLARYATAIGTEGVQKGALLVDLRELLPAPEPLN